MKKNVLIFTILILFVSTINSLTIVKKSEKTLLETDFIPVARSSNYIPCLNTFLFVTIPDAVFMGKGSMKFTRKFYSYDLALGNLQEIDVPEGRTKNCLTTPSYAITRKDTIIFEDFMNGRITAMTLENNKLIHQYSYDSADMLLVPAFNIIGDKMYTSKSVDGSNLSKGLSVYDISKDTLYAGSRVLTNGRHYLDYYRYRSLLDIGMNEKIKKADKERIFAYTWLESRDTENAYFKNYAIKHNGKILIVNSYATDIYRIVDDMEELVDSIMIGLKYRANELNLVKENNFVPMQFDVYSQTHRVFSDESRDFIMLYIQQMEKLRKASGNDCDYILIKKLGVTEGESEWMIPIDFIPVYYNEEESTFYGFRKVDGFLNYVEYKLEV